MNKIDILKKLFVVVVLLLFLLPISVLLHEVIGHGIFCKIYGSEPVLINDNQIRCEGSETQRCIIKLSGGLFSAGILSLMLLYSLILLAKFKKLQLLKSIFTIVFLDMIIVQLINMFLEFFLSDIVYVSLTNNKIFMIAIVFIPLILLILKFDIFFSKTFIKRFFKIELCNS